MDFFQTERMFKSDLSDVVLNQRTDRNIVDLIKGYGLDDTTTAHNIRSSFALQQGQLRKYLKAIQSESWFKELREEDIKYVDYLFDALNVVEYDQFENKHFNDKVAKMDAHLDGDKVYYLKDSNRLFANTMIRNRKTQDKADSARPNKPFVPTIIRRPVIHGFDKYVDNKPDLKLNPTFFKHTIIDAPKPEPIGALEQPNPFDQTKDDDFTSGGFINPYSKLGEKKPPPFVPTKIVPGPYFQEPFVKKPSVPYEHKPFVPRRFPDPDVFLSGPRNPRAP